MSRAGGTGQQHSGLDAESMRRIQYMAHMERRARPPTFRPITIVVVVLAVGLFVIGLIMIVVAHWPGVSAGNGLKIAGGLLIGVGGLVFIITMAVTCTLRNREKEAFEKSIASVAASRSNVNMSNVSMISRPTINSASSYDPRPGKGILKNAGSTSTYGKGSEMGHESDSGVANTFNSYGPNHSYGPADSDNSDVSAGKYGLYKIETLPDPGAARKSRNGQIPNAGLSGSPATGLAGSPALDLSGSAAMGLPGMGLGIHEQSSTDSEQHIPVPMRVSNKKRRGQSSGSASGRQNPSYTADPSDVDVSTGSQPLQDYMYDPNTQAQSRPSTRDPEAAERRRQRRQKRAEQQLAQATADTGVQNQAYAPEDGQSYTPQVTKTTKQTISPTQEGKTTQYITRTTTRYTTEPSSAYPVPQALNTSQEDPLHINIRTSPGTAVHITPGTQYRPSRTVASPSQSSVETEI